LNAPGSPKISAPIEAFCLAPGPSGLSGGSKLARVVGAVRPGMSVEIVDLLFFLRRGSSGRGIMGSGMLDVWREKIGERELR